MSAEKVSTLTDVLLLFLSNSLHIPGNYLKILHDHFISHSFKFIHSLAISHQSHLSYQKRH